MILPPRRGFEGVLVSAKKRRSTCDRRQAWTHENSSATEKTPDLRKMRGLSLHQTLPNTSRIET